MNVIKLVLGSQQLIYRVKDHSLAASWVNHWYSVEPNKNHHSKFGHHKYQHTDQYLSVTTWIDQPAAQAKTLIHAYQWPRFNDQWQSGDLVMGWHSPCMELRQLYQLRDIDSVRKGNLRVVDSITPELRLHFGRDDHRPRIAEMHKDILWWLYENQAIDSVSPRGFEISCHGDPVIARLIYPTVGQVMRRFKPGDRITEMTITPPACF